MCNRDSFFSIILVIMGLGFIIIFELLIRIFFLVLSGVVVWAIVVDYPQGGGVPFLEGDRMKVAFGVDVVVDFDFAIFLLEFFDVDINGGAGFSVLKGVVIGFDVGIIFCDRV